MSWRKIFVKHEKRRGRHLRLCNDDTLRDVMTDYLSKRQNPLRNMDTAEWHRIFDALISAFTKDWLAGRGENPVQVLWARKDDLATIELILLGNAIHRLQLVDPRWVKAQVEKIKGKNRNTRQGALYELLALSLFDGAGVRVKPGDNPGYDGTVFLPANVAIRVSLKSYGLSTHQRYFNDQSAMIEAQLVAGLRQRGITPVTFFAAATRYPGQREWSLLNDELSVILDAYRRTSMTWPQEFPILDAWQVVIVPLPEALGAFSSKYTSYAFVTMAPYHQNEYKNLTDKLDDACTNFTKHAGTLPSETLGLVFVHVPETASVASCKEWACQYFADSPETPLGAILLYQPTVARNINDTTETSVFHSMTVITGPQYQQWDQSRSSHSPAIPLTIRAGFPPKEPIKEVLAWGPYEIPINGKYIYQHGHQYIMAQNDEHGNQFLEVQSIASGIPVHAVGQLSQGEEFTLSGDYPQQDQLLLW